MENYLTSGEAAALLQVTRQTVNNIIGRGELASIKVGSRGDNLLDPDEVERLRKARAENESTGQ